MIAHYKNSSIFYEVYGKGEPLVLLHGFLESSTMWDKLLPLLSQKNKVICIDLPGHGLSEQVSDVHSMELMAEIVHFILEDLSIDRANFIGHSMGGYVTLAFAELFPKKINKLILLNSTTNEDSDERKKNRDVAIKVMGKNASLFITLAISNLFSEQSKEQFKNDIHNLKTEALSFPVEGIIACIKGMKERKNRALVLKKYNNPKFMISGIDDVLIPKSISETNAKETDSTLFFINGGHMSVNENMNDLIKKLHLIDIL